MPTLFPQARHSAHVWRNGAIEIAAGRKPRGAIKLFTFNSLRAATVARRVIEVSARHAYDGETLLVPGVPEAVDDDAAVTALIAWTRWVEPKLHARLPQSSFTTEVRA